ncbi:hypothetical protein HYFRA_00003820 [Hymenoscyphus fraxineus]|uniref:Profilin n=1 Tax=Hymenoscyphus fraxineus TaxID=746836 RepID=A0A9N9PR29_9HELO|nr:hypothetical protein HYFRA_00003820 [Hymenoscyphus fraxineus]
MALYTFSDIVSRGCYRPPLLDSKNTSSTLTRGVNYVSGSQKVLGITVAGTRIYVVASTNEALEVSKNTHELVFDDYIKDLMAAMGHTAEGTEKMWRRQPESMKGVTHPSRYPNPYGKCLIMITQDALRVQLLPGSQSTAVYTALLTDIHTRLERMVTQENI